MLKEANVNAELDWIEFVLVARDFAGDKPLDALPIAKQTAEPSVDAFAMQFLEWPTN